MKVSWTWIAVGLLVLALVVLVGRERFETYEEALASVGQSAGYVVPSCPDGFTMNSTKTSCERTADDGTTETADPTCPEGSRYVKRGTEGQCEGTGESAPSESPGAMAPVPESPGSADAPTQFPKSPGGPPDSPGSSALPPVPGSSGPGMTSGTSTGGVSGASFGPTSAPKGARSVWGPVFTGVGEGRGPVGGDSTKANSYPALLGGMGGRESTKIEGAGIVPPSGLGLGGVMPPSSALGTDPNARFLPFSRQPGDMDLVPDPYRLASNFSSSSYTASKTDPVPFLTDFSAFYK